VGPIGYDLYPMPNLVRKNARAAANGSSQWLHRCLCPNRGGRVDLTFNCEWVCNRGALDDLQSNFAFGSLRLVLLLGVLLCNISESSFLLATSDLWFIFLLLAINLPGSAMPAFRKQEEVNRQHEYESSEHAYVKAPRTNGWGPGRIALSSVNPSEVIVSSL
jgi:hypothetical protein